MKSFRSLSPPPNKIPYYGYGPLKNKRCTKFLQLVLNHCSNNQKVYKAY